MGLLGNGWDDPQSLATLQMAAGLLSPGSFGQGLSRGLSGYQATMANAQDIAAKKQAMEAQNIQLQQQKRMFDLQTPFLEEAVRRMQGQQQPLIDTSAATQAPTGPAQSLALTPEENQRRAALAQANPVQQAPAIPQRSGTMFPGVPDNVAFSTIGTGGFNKIPEMIQKYNEPTEFVKTLIAAGIDPASPQGQDLIQRNLAKANYIAPLNTRPGAIGRDPLTNKPLFFNPHVPEGGTPVFDASGNVTAINPLQGATDIIAARSAAEASGKAQFTPYAGYTKEGSPAPVTSVASVLTPQTPVVGGPATGSQFQASNPAAMRAQFEAIKDPGERAALLSAFDRNFPQVAKQAGGNVFATPPLGATTAAEFQQSDMGKRYSALRDQFSQAQTTTSYLQNIKQLAQTASTGQFADRQKFINSLLDVAGVSEKATDAVTANNLLDKYSNQIVARLGQGGLGTDAARAILQSAYPNTHMTPKAINEAADNLIGANEMVKAKMSLLSPHGNNKDPVSYQKTEQVFDLNADPRLWQLKGMKADEARNFLLSMPASVRADLQQRAKALKEIGAL